MKTCQAFQNLPKNKTLKIYIFNYIPICREEFNTAESDPTLEPQIVDLQRDIAKRQSDLTGVESNKRDCQDEERAIHQRILRITNQINEAQSVQKQKFEVLRTMRQGQDSYKAAVWLKQNQDQFKCKLRRLIKRIRDKLRFIFTYVGMARGQGIIRVVVVTFLTFSFFGRLLK